MLSCRTSFGDKGSKTAREINSPPDDLDFAVEADLDDLGGLTG